MASEEELSYILMRIIRTLSESDSGEQREEQKKHLQIQFRESDQKIDQFVLKKQKELSKVMQLYARVSNRLALSRLRVREIKTSLNACKELLNYKREDLKKHWLDGIEQKHVLELLEVIQDLKLSPEKFDGLTSESNFLEATNLLVSSLKRAKTDLADVEGLSEIRDALEKRKEILYNTLMKNISYRLFNDPERVGLPKGTMQTGLVINKTGNMEVKESQIPSMNDQDIEDFLDQPVVQKINVEDDARQLIVYTECLYNLKKIGNAFEALRSESFNELQGIIRRATEEVREASKDSINANPFPILFDLVIDQFVQVATKFDLISRTMGVIGARNNIWSPNKIDQNEVWAKIQSAIQAMLTEYLDFNNKIAIHQPKTAQYSEPTSDINSFFVRRRTVKPKKATLFRFNASSTGISMHEVAYESMSNNAAEKKTNATELICSPNPHNVTTIYTSLMEFISGIEAVLKYDAGNHCSLYDFVMDYIKDVFLGQIHADHGDTLNEASMLLDSWKAISDVEILRDLKATKPLLQSAVVIKKAIEELLQYMNDLPLYSEHFLTMVCTTVMKYKDICLAAFRGMVQPESEDKRIISAQWAQNEEIMKFLKSMPNWQAVKSSMRPSELTENVDQRSTRETQFIKKQLANHVLSSHEILQDANHLRSLGLLQESMEWFSQGISSVAQKLQRANEARIGGMQKLSSNSIQTLTSFAMEFEEIADTCLIIMHLEVRLHCYFYLSPLLSGGAGALFQGGQDSTDPNQEVVRLNSDFLSIQEVLYNAIEDHKVVFIFEGVPSVVANIFMDSVTNIRKINKNGVKKMCRNIFSVQQALTSNITGSRESALDQAKHFYELMNLRPQDVLNEIVEKGPTYSVEKYTELLQLLHRSDPNSSVEIHNRYATKLQNIVKRIGVTV